MVRPARIEYEGAFYHVMNRGNRKEDIFLDDEDRDKFCKILGKVEARYKIIIYSFVLMTNHYHLLIETPLGNLSRAVQRLNGDYASYFSRRHKRPGHLFQGRFKAMLVEKEAYLLELSRYIHLNPYRAGMVKAPEKYKWSSLYEISGKKINSYFTLYWEWLSVCFGKKKGVAERKYLEFVREGMKKGENPGLEASGGWVLGSEKWVKKIVDKWVDFTSQDFTGIKPLKPTIPIGKLEERVCKEFKVEKKIFQSSVYNNIPRMAIIYLIVNYCGLPLKETGERYGGITGTAVSKVVSRFKERLSKDKNLRKKLENILLFDKI